jgi:hypothetical protein
MPYTFALPNFNLTGVAWVPPHTPAGDPFDIGDFPCQLYIPSRMEGIDQVEGGTGFYTPPIILRLDRAAPNMAANYIVRVSSYPTEYYLVRWVQKVHVGFPNEYRSAIMHQCTAAGISPRP